MGCAEPGGLRCELATPEDDAALRRLLRDGAMDGWVRLAFPREPSYFAAAAVEGRRTATVVVRRKGDGRVVAMGSRSVKQVWLDGRPALLGYLGHLRFAPGWRAGRRTLARAFAMLGARRREDEASFDVTSIVAGNEPARRLLERGLPGMPRYTPLTELGTRVVPTGRGWRWGRGPRHTRDGCRVEVEDATGRRELDTLAELLERQRTGFRLAPRWSRARLEELAGGRLGPWHPLVAVRGGEPVGCGAVWDQRPLRQCVVVGYAPWLERLRVVVNIGRRLAGRPVLPAPGAVLPMAYLSHLDAADGTTLKALVRAARARAAALGIEQLAFGLPPRPSGAERYGSSLQGHTYRSLLYAVHEMGSGGQPPSGGELRVEVATL